MATEKDFRLLRLTAFLLFASVAFLYTCILARGWIKVNIAVTAFLHRSQHRTLTGTENAAGLWDKYHNDSHDTGHSGVPIPPVKYVAQIFAIPTLVISLVTLGLFIYLTLLSTRKSFIKLTTRETENEDSVQSPTEQPSLMEIQIPVKRIRFLRTTTLICLVITTIFMTIIILLRLIELVPMPNHSNLASDAPQVGPLHLRDLETLKGLSGEPEMKSSKLSKNFVHHYEYAFGFCFYLAISGDVGFIICMFNFIRFQCATSNYDTNLSLTAPAIVSTNDDNEYYYPYPGTQDYTRIQYQQHQLQETTLRDEDYNKQELYYPENYPYSARNTFGPV